MLGLGVIVVGCLVGDFENLCDDVGGIYGLGFFCYELVLIWEFCLFVVVVGKCLLYYVGFIWI